MREKNIKNPNITRLLLVAGLVIIVCIFDLQGFFIKKEYPNIFRGVSNNRMQALNAELLNQIAANQKLITELLRQADTLLAVKEIAQKELDSIPHKPMLLNRTPQLKSQLNAALKRTPKPAAPTPVKADDDLAKAIAESLKIDEAKKEADDDLAKVLALSAQDMANIEAKQALPREALVPYQTPDAQRQPGLKLTPKITRIRVTQQNQADCGLHTVLNALWSEKLLKGEIDQSGFSKQITDQDNAKKIEELRAAAMGKNKAWVEASGWIHADAANYLMQQQLSGSAVAPRPTNPNTLPWTIIENITAEHEHIMTTSTMLNYGAPLTAALQKLRNQPKASHIFLVCNTSYTENPDAEDIADRYVGERGHWIAVLVRNEPKVRHYIVQDSLNGDPTESVQALQRFIDSADIEKAIAEEKSTAAVNQVTQARSAIATEAYTRAGELLKAAKPTIEKWRKQNFKNDVVKLFDDLREELALYDY